MGMYALAAPTSATGNCSTGYVQWFTGTNGTGSSVKYCYAVADYDMDNERNSAGDLIKNLGPLHDGTYRTDFAVGGSTGQSNSGLQSVKLWDASGGTDVNVCGYVNKHYGGGGADAIYAFFIHTPGTYNVPSKGATGFDNTVGSFFFTNSGSSSAC